MISVIDLWLPIVASAVAVFLASWLLHMLLTYHKKDYKPLPNEAELMEAMRRAGVSRGSYVFPHCPNPKDMGSPEMKKKYEAGPVGMMSVWPSGVPNMGKMLGLWFFFCILVSSFVACLAGRVLAPGAVPEAVCWLTGGMAFLAYCLAEFVGPIWKGQTWSATLKLMIDGLVYAVVTGGVFAWLWPR
jgi:hypothetical protein